MKVRYLENTEILDLPKPFYQSKGWIEVATQEGLKARRFVVEDQDDIMVYASVFIYPLKFFGYQLYIPRGPILSSQAQLRHLERFAQEIQTIAQDTRAHFCLIEPDIFSTPRLQDSLEKVSRSSSRHRLPHQTQKIDLTLSTEDLLAQMKSKTRYNIKLAQKKGVKIQSLTINDPEFTQAFDAFYDIMSITSTRGKFFIHKKDHYHTILATHTPNFTPYLAIATHEGDTLAANLMLDTQDESIYLHGGSSNIKRNLMATYLIQWHGITQAKSQGKQCYDLWGTSDTQKSWEHLTRFKRGFGGQTVTYPDTRVIITNPIVYKLYSWYMRDK